MATNDPGITSFAALDALLKHLKARWRGLAYAAYDRAMLSRNPQRTVTIVPGCAHDVACVFPNEAARSALFGARP